MTDTDAKADLHRYLRTVREAVLWKLDWLSEYDIRRPLARRTGTVLLQSADCRDALAGATTPSRAAPVAARTVARTA